MEFAQRLKAMQPWLEWTVKHKQKELLKRLRPLVPEAQLEEQNTAALLHDFQRAWQTLCQPQLCWDLNVASQLLRCALALAQKLLEHQHLSNVLDVFFEPSVHEGLELAQSLERWLKSAPEQREPIQSSIAAFLQARTYKLDGVMERYSSWQHTAASLYKGAVQYCTQLASQARDSKWLQ